MPGGELIAELLEAVVDFAGAKSVLEGVAGDGSLAFWGDGAGGPLGVAAVGGGLFFGCHGMVLRHHGSRRRAGNELFTLFVRCGEEPAGE